MRFSLCLVFIFFMNAAIGQEFTLIPIADLPEPISNNAVESITLEGNTYVYSFGGISDISSCGTPHLRSYKYDLALNEWSSIPPIPDTTGGVIAAGASRIKDKIYLVGGYQVRPDCSEYTSPFFHAFDPVTETYTRLPDVPVPVDDHVQVVWNDSLLILVTGWSNTRNVINVQVFNPATNEWSAATPIPNSSKWRVFGASGSIVGDTLYFMGGAGPTCNSAICFPATEHFRKGYINPDDPTQIEWIGYEDEKAIGYRMAASTYKGKPIWFGGANATYNFDAIDYNTDDVVQPNQRISFYRPVSGEIVELVDVFPELMDLRGVAKVGEDTFIFVGGLGRDQQVRDQAVYMKIDRLSTGVKSIIDENDLSIFPNPVLSSLNIKQTEFEGNYFIYDQSGKLILDGRFHPNLDVSFLIPGIYQLVLENKAERISTSFIKK